MAELDLETIERAVRWCAEAGRQTTPGELRLALGTLGWDQLLTVRALLADPPPARPLGPHALADLARGVPADVAADRERAERYPRPGAAPSGPLHPPAPAGPPTAIAAVKKGRKGSRRAQVVVRKASAAPTASASQPPRLPLFEELLLPAGRGALERLLRRHGGRRPMLVAAIAATHRRADGGPVGDADLDAALEHHGLDRAFLRRERDELSHAVRAAGAVLTQAAAALGHDLASLGAAVARLGLEDDVRRLRDARRRDLRARATLAERALLLVGSADKLADLELVAEFERDLKERLPEHLRALSTTGEPLELGLARTLALPVTTVRPLLVQLGVELKVPEARPRAASTPATAAPRVPASPPRAAPRPATAGASPRSTTPRPTGGRPTGGRPTGGRPTGGRPTGGRPTGGRPTGGRPTGGRPTGGRPTGGRPTGGRPTGGRPTGSRPSPRKPGSRSSGPGRPSTGGGRRGPSR
jgi:hypothetical protein